MMSDHVKSPVNPSRRAIAPEHLLPDHLAHKDSAGRWRSRGVAQS